MKKRSSTLQEVEKAIKTVAGVLGCSKVILFVSMARGTHTERSDVDLGLIKNNPVRFLDRSVEVLPLLADQIRGRGIDDLVYTPAEIEKMATHRNRFIERGLTEGKVVYGT